MEQAVTNELIEIEIEIEYIKFHDPTFQPNPTPYTL